MIFDHLDNEIEFNLMGNNNRWNWDPQANIWYHLALVRYGPTLKVFVDGSGLALSAGGTDSSDISCSGTPRVGLGYGGLMYMHGHIDELRISKGVARWDSGFTPLTESYYGISGPGWITDTADLISPENAEAYYNSIGLASIVAEASSTTATPEITELARALQNDPKLIYDYVHNNIDYVPYFGLQKGATKTYLDGRGNDFDQASLMVALLRASGYTAQFVYGEMDIPGAQLANCIGVDQDPQVIGKVIPSGGIPASILHPDGRLQDMGRVWVKTTINGADYLFDPAFKSYDYTTKIDIGQALGYDRNTLIGAATAGANVGSDYVQNLNETGLANKLEEYSTNFVNHIKSQYPNSDIKEIIGGRSIVQTNIDQYQTSLPFPTVIKQTWDDIPSAYTTTISIKHQGTGINQIYSIPEIAGNRLTLTYSGAYPELKLDGVVVATGSATTPGNKYTLTITIDHPYAGSGGSYQDQTSVYTVQSGSTYAIITDFGGMSDAVIKKRQKELDNYINQGLSDTSEQVLDESLNIMGLTWLYETDLVVYLLEDLADTIFIPHHKVGLMAQEAGYYVDVKTPTIDVRI